MEAVDRQKMSGADLRKKAGIAPNTLTRMKKNHEVTVQVLKRICKALDSDFGELWNISLMKKKK